MRQTGFLLFGLLVVLLFSRCGEVRSIAPPVEEPTEETRALECSIKEATTMGGTALKLVVPTLWVEFSRDTVYRADEYPFGRVIRNPYSLEKVDLPKALAEAASPFSTENTYRFRQGDHYKWLLMDEYKGRVLSSYLLTPNEPMKAGGERLEVVCTEVPGGSIKAHEELVEVQGDKGCADLTAEQLFAENMIGCSGTVPFRDRADLCAKGWSVCTAAQWVARRGKTAPTFTYWTEDDLRYSGFSSRCMVSATSGRRCTPAAEPMRICAGKRDPLGNNCNWIGCGLDDYGQNTHFGGCARGDTAGAVCCQ